MVAITATTVIDTSITEMAEVVVTTIETMKMVIPMVEDEPILDAADHMSHTRIIINTDKPNQVDIMVLIIISMEPLLHHRIINNA